MTEANLYKYLFQEEQLYVLPNDPLLQKIDDTRGMVEERNETYEVSETRVVASVPDVSAEFQPKSDVVIVIDTQSKGLPEEERLLITKIMQSVGYDIEKLDVIDVSQSKISVEMLAQIGGISKMILFGIQVDKIDFYMEPTFYQIQNRNGVLVLLSDPLKEINTDVTKKRLLWGALQSIFK